MEYRQLGKTGLKAAKLGFGSMRLPYTDERLRYSPDPSAKLDRDLSIAMIHRAFEGGVNYIDSSTFYCHDQSESIVGEALKGWRDKIIVSTKNPDFTGTEKAWWTNLETSLKRLQIDYIDAYYYHGMSWEKYVNDVEPRISKWMRKAYDQGLVKHICGSIHDTNDNVKKIIDSGCIEVMTVQYNILDRQLEDAIAHAGSKGLGVVIMGPLAGGRLGGGMIPEQMRTPGAPVKSWAELALQFVWSNPNVSVALSGMMRQTDVEQNLAAEKGSLTENDRNAIIKRVEDMRAMRDLYCTGCAYCTPCPAEVNIPAVFKYYNDGRTLGLWDAARHEYKKWEGWNPGKKADACTECGVCEEKCPQKIEIRKNLALAHAELTNAS